jgi:translation initiation factor 1
MKDRNSNIVYSTDGLTEPEDESRCSDGLRPLSGLEVRIQLDRKQRAGKSVTVVTGIRVAGEQLIELAREIKSLCASGGTVKDGHIEIQGDHRSRVDTFLRKKGYKTRVL